MKAETVEPGISVGQVVIEQPASELLPPAQPPVPVTSKNAIRRSLRASTLDGVFSTIFSNITGGVLLSNFLVELDASPTQVGLLASIPMLANLIQPLGAFLGDRTTSRHYYCLWVYGPARFLWLILAAIIALAGWHTVEPQLLVLWTLAIVFVTNFLGALGSASWLSWLASLVPRRLRGRYFGIRNSASSLTNLLSVPVLGWIISAFPGGSIQGYGIILVLGVVAGLVSLGFQYLIVDVNPQVQDASGEAPGESRKSAGVDEIEGAIASSPSSLPSAPSFIKDTNFLFFLLYFSLWMFAVNLSAPFFNLYMLDNLSIDVRWVTIYNSLQAGANMLMLVLWGKLADRVGNRNILITVGILVAVTPLFWLGTGINALSTWLWLPLLHVLAGVTWAAIDLCNNNLQLGVAPVRHQANYFAVAAAVAGVSGALGTTAGGFLAEFANYGGIPGLFALSAIVRLVAILPLVFVHEQRGQSLRQMMGVLFPTKTSEQHGD
ncbi:MFS transporter [Leptothermofonsia sp. ETS-13]|uniref:MFS transporter n=1 Tax=Leptothermofonsia sp. ETS-13 TaxID=3035696 RepID=UPI003B9E1FBD